MTNYRIERSDDFEQVYDLDDPAPYYAPLADADYRMPGELAGWLDRSTPWLRTELGTGGRPLRALDFACGYGFVGAVLRHRVDVGGVYAYYASRPWAAGDGRANWSADAAWFAVHRNGGRDGSMWELTGLDIAGNAVAYAEATGLIDRGFTDSIPDDGVGPELARYLETVDLVVESGAIGGIYPECFGPIVDGGRRPWFVYCPRPSVDLGPLDALWADVGYEVERREPAVPYRKPIGRSEREELLDQTVAAGNDPTTAFVGDHLAVEIHLARPRR